LAGDGTFTFLTDGSNCASQTVCAPETPAIEGPQGNFSYKVNLGNASSLLEEGGRFAIGPIEVTTPPTEINGNNVVLTFDLSRFDSTGAKVEAAAFPDGEFLTVTIVPGLGATPFMETEPIVVYRADGAGWVNIDDDCGDIALHTWNAAAGGWDVRICHCTPFAGTLAADADAKDSKAKPDKKKGKMGKPSKMGKGGKAEPKAKGGAGGEEIRSVGRESDWCGRCHRRWSGRRFRLETLEQEKEQQGKALCSWYHRSPRHERYHLNDLLYSLPPHCSGGQTVGESAFFLRVISGAG